jgi:hypothetical protein
LTNIWSYRGAVASTAIFFLLSLSLLCYHCIESAYFTYIFNIYSAHVNAKFGAKLLIFNVITKFFSTFFQYVDKKVTKKEMLKVFKKTTRNG